MFVLCEGGGGEVLQSAKQNLQGEDKNEWSIDGQISHHCLNIGASNISKLASSKRNADVGFMTCCLNAMCQLILYVL